MKSMFIGGIILIISLMGGTYFVAGDAFITDDYINNLTMLGAFAIIAITVFTAIKYINQIKNDKASGELKNESWDGIGEYKNDVPKGWALAYIGTMVWGIWYLLLGYPTNQYSQLGQWNEETLEYKEKFEKKWHNADEKTLQSMGESLYLVQCAPCHGVDAEGINGKAQDLTKRVLKSSVKYIIKNGANNFKTAYPGGMPAMMLSDEKEIDEVSSYVANGFKGTAPAAYESCASCHGIDGKGMEYVAPNILAYDDALMHAVLLDGKKAEIGAMPSFRGRLSNTQEKALAAYIRSLGE
mgnify:CR=1 FL=1